jgi:hypothetical protein
VVEPQTAQAGNTDSRSVWDGIYTAAQATQGKVQFEVDAVHATGLISPAALAKRSKATFSRTLEGISFKQPFQPIKSTMPSGAPAS